MLVMAAAEIVSVALAFGKAPKFIAPAGLMPMLASWAMTLLWLLFHAVLASAGEVGKVCVGAISATGLTSLNLLAK